MTLQGWSLPLSPGGTASLVPPPPWHFSGEAIGIDFRADDDAIAAVLPDGLVPVGDGSCSFTFCEWSSSAETDPRVMADPARGQYREAYVSVNALLDGKKVTRVPYIWVDNDLSLARGHVQGFPKKLGAVHITRAARVGRGSPRIEAGSRFAAHASSVGTKVVQGAVTLTHPAEEGYIPRSLRLPVWHTRYFPDLGGGGPLVHDLARNLITGFELADVWQGTGELELLPSEFEEHTALAPIEITGGFKCAVAFTITGAEVRS